MIPALGEVGVLDGFDANGKPKTRKAKRDITLRHLLTHTAGFGYDIWSPEIAKYMEAMEVPGIISCQNKALTTPLLFDPGERWFYGINIDFAGKMVEAASGQKLGKYMQDNLFGPLGMDSTAFRITDGMRKRLARIHHRGADGALTPIPRSRSRRSPSSRWAAAGSTAPRGDYLKFVRMMLNQGKSDKGEAVLKPETVAEMSKNAMGDAKVCLLKTAMPPFSNDAEFFPGMDKQWGLSFMINNEEAPTGRSAGVAGLGGARQHLLLDRPEEGRGRRLCDPDPALRRREVAAAVLRLRKRGVRAIGASFMFLSPGGEELDSESGRTSAGSCCRNRKLEPMLASGSAEVSCSTKRCLTPARSAARMIRSKSRTPAPTSVVEPSDARSFRCTSRTRSLPSFRYCTGSCPALATQYTSSSSLTSRGSVSVIIKPKGVVPSANGANSKS